MYTGKLYLYEGQMLSVKTIAGKVELAPSTLYKYLNQGFSLYDAIDEGKKKSQVVFKNRAKTNNRIAKKYLYNGEMHTIEEISRIEEVSPEALYRRLQKGINLEEAIEAIQKNISKKYPFRKGFYSAYKISVITGIPKYYLLKQLDPDKEYKEEDIETIISSYQKDILMVGDVTLYQFCIQNQYNYNVLFYMIKSKGLTVDEAIFQYLKLGQKDSFSYAYALGNILLYHFCIKECLNNRYINDRMQKGDRAEDAIIASIFLAGEEYSTRNIRNELYNLYQQLGIEKVLELDIGLKHKDYLVQRHNRVLEVMKNYHLYQAISILSTDLTTEDRKSVLQRFDLSEDDLIKCSDELFDGFTIRSKNDSLGPVNYIWDISSKKSQL